MTEFEDFLTGYCSFLMFSYSSNSLRISVANLRDLLEEGQFSEFLKYRKYQENIFQVCFNNQEDCYSHVKVGSNNKVVETIVLDKLVSEQHPMQEVLKEILQILVDNNKIRRLTYTREQKVISWCNKQGNWESKSSDFFWEIYQFI